MNELNYAGFWWRVLAHLIDTIIVTTVILITGFCLGIALGIGMLMAGLDKATLLHVCRIIGYIFGLSGQWLYYATMESSPWQATLGKKICGLIVTDTEGRRLSFAHASKRFWAKVLAGFTLLVGYVMAAFTARKQALHDKIASTLVLKQTD